MHKYGSRNTGMQLRFHDENKSSVLPSLRGIIDIILRHLHSFFYIKHQHDEILYI